VVSSEFLAVRRDNNQGGNGMGAGGRVGCEVNIGFFVRLRIDNLEKETGS